MLDEPPIARKERAREGWRGYFSAFPHYVVYPRRIAETEAGVAILGHTTGSHLGLPDEAEFKLTVIWLATVRAGLVASWTILEDLPETRTRLGLDSA